VSKDQDMRGGLLTRWVLSNRGGAIFLAVLAVTAIAVPILNQWVPESSPLHVPTFVVTLVGKYLCYALLALALDLVWGYLGILSLGHGAFFALGGYAMGMYLMRQIGARGVYGNPELPDFMVFLDWTELPWYWYGFDNFGFAMVMALAVPGLLALVFGWLAFRSHVTGVYLSIITQALTYALMLAFFRNNMGFGGNNGLTDFKDLLGFDLQADETRIALFLCSAAALAGGYLLCNRLVSSRLGRVVMAVRDAEGRVRSLGYRDERIKLFVFTVSAMMAGAAGALYVPQVGIINPGEFAPVNSIEVVIWVAIGGRGTLFGAAAGAVLVSYAKSWFTVAYPEIWLFFLGLLFVVVTIVLPRGLVGFIPGGPRSPPTTTKPVGIPDTTKVAAGDGAEDRSPVASNRTQPNDRPETSVDRDLSVASPADESTSMSVNRHIAADTLLYLDDVAVCFDGLHAIDGLSLVVAERELRCIIGPNGAGKTTLMDIITGRTRPDRGKVIFGDQIDLTHLDEASIANLGVGRKFQKPTVFVNHTVFENIELALGGRRGVLENLWFRMSAVDHERIHQVLETIGLAEECARPAGELSHGRKQWLEIGMLLAQEPRLLLVDEPVAGMTGQETERTAELLTRLAEDHCVVVVEHDMDFVRSIAHRVTVLHQGRVLAEGSMEQMQRDPHVNQVYLGE